MTPLEKFLAEAKERREHTTIGRWKTPEDMQNGLKFVMEAPKTQAKMEKIIEASVITMMTTTQLMKSGLEYEDMGYLKQAIKIQVEFLETLNKIAEEK